MENKAQLNSSKILLGSILVIVGGLFLLRSFNLLPFEISHIIFSWRFIIFIIGIIIFINSDNKVLGSILTIVGTLLLLPKIFPYYIHIDGGMIVGIIIIGLGIYIILRTGRSNFHPMIDSSNKKGKQDFIDDVAVFGGGEKIISSDNFKGGSITAIFGGSEIDLTPCKLAEGTNLINVTAIFGGTTIIVPRDWNVIVNVTPLFGGFSNKIRREPNFVIDQTRTLIIKGIAIFGGGEIKTLY